MTETTHHDLNIDTSSSADFVPMRGVSNRHLQTMLPRLIRRKLQFTPCWQRLELPDGDFVDDWSDLGPSWQVAIVPATAQSLERLTASTSIGVASHIVTGPYRSDVTLKTSLLYGSRRLSVVSLIDPNERHKELVLLCQEIVP